MSSEHINISERIISYHGDGQTTKFSCPFIVWDDSGLDVYINDVLQPKNSYTLSDLGKTSGCFVTFSTAPDNDSVVSFVGDTPRERSVDYNQYVTLTADSMNLDANYQEVQIQENTTALKRTLLTPVSDGVPGKTLTLPSVEERKNAYLAFDDEGNPIALGDAQNIVYGLGDKGSTARGVMIWADDSGRRAGDSKRVFGEPNGAATLGPDGKVPEKELPNLGHAILSDGQGVPFRKKLNFSKEFAIKNDDAATNVRLDLRIIKLGDGSCIIQEYDKEGNFNVHSLLAGPNVGIQERTDGAFVISAAASPEKRYIYQFTEENWDEDLQLVILPELHGLGENGDLLVAVRDAEGYQTHCNVNVSSIGVIVVKSDIRFSGKLIIYGAVLLNEALLVNPMIMRGDLIVGGLNGAPERLMLGRDRQALVVNNAEDTPEWATLGEAAWKDLNIPGGVPELNAFGEIPDEMLPTSTMTYKGTFGSENSTTGGDLPTEGILDGDAFICDMDNYSSEVSGITFNMGQWALYSGAEWNALPLENLEPIVSGTLPVGSIIPFAGTVVPNNYLACNGYVLSKATYSKLYDVIGTVYNTGSESDTEFSIPNYNKENLFLQGSTTAGTKHQAGLPNVVGTIGYDGNADVSGCFKYIGGCKGADGGSWNNSLAEFRASYSNSIYGKSNTVQPPSQTVIFLIKYK